MPSPKIYKAAQHSDGLPKRGCPLLPGRRHERAGFHDPRRLVPTAVVVAGVDIKAARTCLGHSDPTTTLATYAASPAEADRASADRLEHRFLPGDGSGSVRANYVLRRPNPELCRVTRRESAGAGTPADQHLPSSRAARI